MSDSRYSAQHAADPDEFVRVADVVKIFGDVVAGRSVNLSVKRNEIFALLGSSGSGKATLLQADCDNTLDRLVQLIPTAMNEIREAIEDMRRQKGEEEA